MLTQARLKELLDYNPETGEWVWISPQAKSVKPRQIAGRINGQGYREISVGNRRYASSRLAFLYMTGNWPDALMDHRDGNPWNDRWENLRCASAMENCRNARLYRNSATGLKGVKFHKGWGKFQARICVAKKTLYLGGFDTAAEAHAAYIAAAKEHFGEFARLA